jgi:SAM-dependent methyltransferase
MPTLAWNIGTWDGDYNWGAAGEEWSEGWGGSEAQWFGSLYPRLHRFLPASRVLEIAPGFGRWTPFLLAGCDELVGIDLSEACVDACKQRFASAANARFLKNDGISLDAAEGRFDFVFSFDSLVHAEIDVFENYIPQIVSKLTPGGVAFIHHSNFSGSGATENRHSRATSVTGLAVAQLVDQAGGRVLSQELINWGSKELIDCLTLVSTGPASGYPQAILNPDFMEEARLIKANISPYCKL